MLVGMISTLRDKCFLSDYTNRLLIQLNNKKDFFVRLLVDVCEYMEKDEQTIIENAWNNIEQTSQSCDFFHLQWLSGLYDESFLRKLIAIGKPIIITLHDFDAPQFLIEKCSGFIVFNDFTCIDAETPIDKTFGSFIGMNNEKFYEPMITNSLKVLVLGEGDIDTIELACSLANYKLKNFEIQYTLYNPDYYDYEELIDAIVSSHIVIMGCLEDKKDKISHRAYNVIDCGRVLITNYSEYFYRLSDDFVLRGDDVKEISDHLIDVVENYGSYLEKLKQYKNWLRQNRSWDQAIQGHIDTYETIFNN